MYSQQCFSRRGRGAGRRDGGRVVRETQQPQPSTQSRRGRGAGRGQYHERSSSNLQNNANKRRRLDDTLHWREGRAIWHGPNHHQNLLNQPSPHNQHPPPQAPPANQHQNMLHLHEHAEHNRSVQDEPQIVEPPPEHARERQPHAGEAPPDNRGLPEHAGDWYFLGRNGEPQGPHTTSEMIRMRTEGSFNGSTRIRRRD